MRILMNILTIKNFKSIDPQELKKYQDFRKSILHSHSDIHVSQSKLEYLHNYYFPLVMKDIGRLFKIQTGEELVSAQLINSKSTFHLLFNVKTNKDHYALKVSLLNEFYKDLTFYLDYSIQKLLSDLHLPTYEIFSIDVSRTNVSYDYMIMEYIDGESLENYSKENKKDIYKSLGKLFNKIHHINVIGVGHIDILNIVEGKVNAISDSWSNFITTNLNHHINLLKKRNLISINEGKIIRKLFANVNIRSSSLGFTLLHNDPGSRNILVENENISAILDWEDAIVGDPYWDIAFIETFLFRENDSELFENFCQGYGIYIKNVHTSFNYLLYYLRIVLLKAVNRSNIGYYNKEGFLMDQERIRKSLLKLQNFFPA